MRERRMESVAGEKSGFASSLRREYSDREIARASYSFTFWLFIM